MDSVHNFVISFYDEWNTIYSNINSIKTNNPNHLIILVHSTDNSSLYNINQYITSTNANVRYFRLPNLANEFPRFEVPARALVRNFSIGANIALQDGYNSWTYF